VATGRIGDSFILLSSLQDLVLLGVFCARFLLREASILNYKTLNADCAAH
jgi:hypothetical protein